MTIQKLTSQKFASLISLKRANLAWFLGAGASASAGIPTGYTMITDFKKRLFCEGTGLREQEVDGNDPIWSDRIDHYFTTKSVLPPANDPTEYAAAFEAVFKNPDERRRYIENAIKLGTPSFAHRALASMITNRLIPCIFTTNFDQLIETATTITDQLMPAEDRAHLTVAAIDSVDRAELCLRESGWPLLAKLHGDFQSIELKNTSEELRVQDHKMRSVLTGACSAFGLVIVGYSGRDESIMDALIEALTSNNSFPGGIYWVARDADSLLPRVKEFLEAANEVGISASIVESHTFDELAADIIDRLEMPDLLRNHTLKSHDQGKLQLVPLPEQESRAFPVLQCSAVPILSMLKAARLIKLNTAISTVDARRAIKDAKVKAIVACNGKEIAAFGSDEDLLRTFSNYNAELAGTVELHPESDSWAMGLLYDALARSVCRQQPFHARLKRTGHCIVVSRSLFDADPAVLAQKKNSLSKLNTAYSAALYGDVPKLGFFFSEGIRLKLEYAANRWWCVFEPSTFTDAPRINKNSKGLSGGVVERVKISKKDRFALADWQRERWARRYNRQWASIISAWAEILSGTGGGDGCIRSLGINEANGVDGLFQISTVTAWSRPSHTHSYFQRSGR